MCIRDRLQTVRILGRDAKSLPRFARDHLGTITGKTLVVPLWERADPRSKLFGALEARRELDQPLRTFVHQIRDDLGDLAQTREVVVFEGDADHGVPPPPSAPESPLFCAGLSPELESLGGCACGGRNARILVTASATGVVAGAVIRVRGSAGDG